jgi:hypothetical protein
MSINTIHAAEHIIGKKKLRTQNKSRGPLTDEGAQAFWTAQMGLAHLMNCCSCD